MGSPCVPQIPIFLLWSDPLAGIYYLPIRYNLETSLALIKAVIFRIRAIATWGDLAVQPWWIPGLMPFCLTLCPWPHDISSHESDSSLPSRQELVM